MKKLISLTAVLLILGNTAFVFAEDASQTVLTLTYEAAEEIMETFEQDEYQYTKSNVLEIPIMAQDTKEIRQVKSASSKSNLPEVITYEDEDGYIGELHRGTISTSVNGYTTKTYTMSDSKYYYGLPSRDLININKSVVKNGVTLKLTDVNWINSNNEAAGDTAVGAIFTCKAYYSGTYTKKEPTGYTSTAEYIGSVTRDYVERVTYEVSYIGEPLPEPEQPFNPLPLAAGIGSIGGIAGVLWFFFLKKNTQVYNLQNGSYELVGKLRIRAAQPNIKLDGFSHKVKSNLYRIQLSRSLANQLTGQELTVTQGNHSIKHKVQSGSGDYSFDLTI